MTWANLYNTSLYRIYSYGRCHRDLDSNWNMRISDSKSRAELKIYHEGINTYRVSLEIHGFKLHSTFLPGHTLNYAIDYLLDMYNEEVKLNLIRMREDLLKEFDLPIPFSTNAE